MHSTVLLPWKNQKGLTFYPMILYKPDSTAYIFLWIFKKIFGQAISQNSSKPLILKVFICLECQMITVFVELRKSNCRNGRNVAIVLRAMVKSHNRLKGTKVFACGFPGRNLKIFSKICRGLFIVKLHHVTPYKRLLGQFYRKRDAYTETLHNYFL